MQVFKYGSLLLSRKTNSSTMRQIFWRIRFFLGFAKEGNEKNGHLESVAVSGDPVAVDVAVTVTLVGQIKP
jgi:hypothetical protein